MGNTFDLAILADRIADALREVEAALRLEQSVYGLDSKDELELHAVLGAGLRSHYEVAQEVHYPSSRGKRLSGRQRCDLVLTEKGRPLRLDSAPQSLFDPPNQAEAQEGLWLEVKVASQFREGGVRHSGYGQQWRSAVVEDLRKMDADAMIRQAALLLVVFNESPQVIEKDLDLFEEVLARQEVLAGFRQVRSFSIVERIGHHLCTASLWPTIQRDDP